MKSCKGVYSSHILSEVVPIPDRVGKLWLEGTGYKRE